MLNHWWKDSRVDLWILWWPDERGVNGRTTDGEDKCQKHEHDQTQNYNVDSSIWISFAAAYNDSPWKMGTVGRNTHSTWDMGHGRISEPWWRRRGPCRVHGPRMLPVHWASREWSENSANGSYATVLILYLALNTPTRNIRTEILRHRNDLKSEYCTPNDGLRICDIDEFNGDDQCQRIQLLWYSIRVIVIEWMNPMKRMKNISQDKKETMKLKLCFSSSREIWRRMRLSRGKSRIVGLVWRNIKTWATQLERTNSTTEQRLTAYLFIRVFQDFILSGFLVGTFVGHSDSIRSDIPTFICWKELLSISI